MNRTFASRLSGGRSSVELHHNRNGRGNRIRTCKWTGNNRLLCRLSHTPIDFYKWYAAEESNPDDLRVGQVHEPFCQQRIEKQPRLHRTEYKLATSDDLGPKIDGHERSRTAVTSLRRKRPAARRQGLRSGSQVWNRTRAKRLSAATVYKTVVRTIALGNWRACSDSNRG